MTTTMTAHEWLVFLSLVFALFAGCMVVIIGGIKVLDLADRAREHDRPDRK